MKRLMYLMAILLISSVVARADETITVSATNSDIAANLDLKVVAKIFGEAKDLEDFEARLNNPDSAFVNLDLNGDGDVDYIRVIETTNGNRHLIVLQAVLAKDIYQDVASIYVEKDEANNVSVQVIGDEYIYGANYVIEPVYIYRPAIYDWFWSPYWVCWSSPWYWGWWPNWWYTWHPVHFWAYWDHCHHFHHHHHGCSFHYAKNARPGSRTIGQDVHRNDYATANPGKSFSQRNSGLINARELPVSTRTVTASEVKRTGTAETRNAVTTMDRSYGSSYTSTRSTSNTRSGGTTTVTTTRSTNSGAAHPATSVSATRSGGSSSGSTTRSTSTSSTSTRPSSSSTVNRPSSTSTTVHPSTNSSATRSTSTSSSRPSTSSSSSRPSSSSTVNRPSSSGSSSHPSSGSVSRPSGGGASTRR